MDDHPLGQWLSYRETMPLSWQPGGIDSLPALQAEHNQRVLAAVATLEERWRTDGDTAQAQELDRLHHKFDVMIELLGALLRSIQPQATPHSLQLCIAGLSWTPQAPLPAIGSSLTVSLQLHPCAPNLWRWAGEVIAHRGDEIFVRFAPMPDALSAALERHVFMRHRRSVADARSPASRGQRESPP